MEELMRFDDAAKKMAGNQLDREAKERDPLVDANVPKPIRIPLQDRRCNNGALPHLLGSHGQNKNYRRDARQIHPDHRAECKDKLQDVG
jgi:hypothetical protein